MKRIIMKVITFLLCIAYFALKVITVLLIIASIALNACLFAGCKSLHNYVYGKPCKFIDKSELVNKSELVEIARLLGIETSGKSASDLSSDIRIKLDDKVEAPIAFDSAAFEKMAKDLRVEEKKSMIEYHQFISDLQDKRVIVIERED